jgi:bacillolysin
VSMLKHRVGVKGALAILIAVVAVLNYSTVHNGQGNAIPRSPVDATTTAHDRVLSESEKDAAFEALMRLVDAQGASGPIGRLRVKDFRNEWTHKGTIITRGRSGTHFRLSQVHRGLKVRGGQLVLELADGQSPDLTVVRAEYVDDIQVDIAPRLSRERAISIAKQLARKEVDALGGPAVEGSSETPNQSLRVVGPAAANDDASLEIHAGEGRGKRKLVWHVSTRANAANGPVLMEAWVDQDANVVEAYNNLQSGIFGGTGHTLYQGDRAITLDAAGGGYVINDNSLLIGVYDNYDTTSSTYQAWSPTINIGNHVFGHASTDQRNTTNADTYATTSQTLSFMYWVLGRDFVDGNRGPRYYGSVSGGTLISARNHVGSNYNNAYWDPPTGTINLGDGDGTTFRSFASLDIVGHEWQHGVTQYTAGLVYRNEPGAINESFSDIMGAMTERYWRGESGNQFTTNCTLAGNCTTWKIGDESYTPGTAGDSMRYMNEPWRNGYPWHYSQRVYPDPCTPSIFNDNCGVHTNSSISNFAFYSLSKGWPGAVSAIGADKATQIFYKAIRDCMISSDGFAWTRRCTEWAAGSLYGSGSYEQNQTRAAWNFVGAPL